MWIPNHYNFQSRDPFDYHSWNPISFHPSYTDEERDTLLHFFLTDHQDWNPSNLDHSFNTDGPDWCSHVLLDNPRTFYPYGEYINCLIVQVHSISDTFLDNSMSLGLMSNHERNFTSKALQYAAMSPLLEWMPVEHTLLRNHTKWPDPNEYYTF